MIPQVPAVQEYVSDLLESGQKFLLFAHHKSLLDGVEFTMRKCALNPEESPLIRSPTPIIFPISCPSICRLQADGTCEVRSSFNRPLSIKLVNCVQKLNISA